MDIQVILTAIGTVLAVAGINLGIFSWLKSDLKSFETEIRLWREELYKESKENINELKNKEKRMKEEYVKKLEDYVYDKEET